MRRLDIGDTVTTPLGKKAKVLITRQDSIDGIWRAKLIYLDGDSKDETVIIPEKMCRLDGEEG